MSTSDYENIILEILKSNQVNLTKECFTLLQKLFTNIINNPTEEKYKQFNKNNEHLKSKVLNLNKTLDLLTSLGYEESNDSKDLLVYSKNNTDSLKKCCDLLSKSLNILESNLNKSQNKVEIKEVEEEDGGELVTLLVYDISGGMARSLSPMLLKKTIEGVWHTGLVVYGVEYYFGGGICSDKPKKTPYGIPVKEIKIGKTYIPNDLFSEYLKEIRYKYSAESYNVLNNNCNHFTNAISEFLTGKSIPNDILKQHEVLLGTPMGNMILPMLEKMGQGSIPNQFEKR